MGQLHIIQHPCIDSPVDCSAADGRTMLFQTQPSCDFFRRPLMFDVFVLDESKQVRDVQFFVRTALLACDVYDTVYARLQEYIRHPCRCVAVLLKWLPWIAQALWQ